MTNPDTPCSPKLREPPQEHAMHPARSFAAHSCMPDRLLHSMLYSRTRLRVDAHAAAEAHAGFAFDIAESACG